MRLLVIMFFWKQFITQTITLTAEDQENLQVTSNYNHDSTDRLVQVWAEAPREVLVWLRRGLKTFCEMKFCFQNLRDCLLMEDRGISSYFQYHPKQCNGNMKKLRAERSPVGYLTLSRKISKNVKTLSMIVYHGCPNQRPITGYALQ